MEYIYKILERHSEGTRKKLGKSEIAGDRKVPGVMQQAGGKPKRSFFSFLLHQFSFYLTFKMHCKSNSYKEQQNRNCVLSRETETLSFSLLSSSEWDVDSPSKMGKNDVCLCLFSKWRQLKSLPARSRVHSTDLLH